ncbi:cytochrome b562 [Paraburkholderia azotifigens]|uniref:Cytochrome b562 n=1 Tax=Paraburkholderia azotifigens TaxID=2057004 RepID=A0A5C6V392_9BURK|nr:cytochrome b562 [Paraburkholderia azotifigens]TXC79793.1 cytochrome B562 [Paraburkholderia azotifigens]
MAMLPFHPHFRTLLCVSLLVAAPLAHAGEIKTLMKDMKLAMQGALSSTTMPELRGYVTRLESDAQRASSQPYRSDQSTYDEGMRSLQQELTEVDRAIQADDMNAAKRALHRINGTRKHYHDLLS